MDKETFKKVTVTIPEKVIKDYRKICTKNGLNLSGRITVLIKKDMQKFIDYDIQTNIKKEVQQDDGTGQSIGHTNDGFTEAEP